MSGRTPQAWWPAAALGFNALVWGLSWWPLQRLQAAGVHALWATAAVYLCALLGVFALHGRVWRGFTQHPGLWLLALASGLTNVGFNWAVSIGDVLRVVLLFYLMPAWSVLLAWWLLDERPSAGSLLRVALALAGVLIVLQSPQDGWPWPRSLADVLALLGGASFALTNVLLRRLRAAPEGTRMMAMFSGGASLGSLCALGGVGLGLLRWPALPDPATALVGAGLALAFLGGNLALQYGAARLRASTTALIMLSEIVFASLSSIAAGAAEASLRSAIGAAFILGAALLAARAESAAD